MRTEETGGDEEGFVLLLLHKLDRFGGDHAVGLFFVLAISRQPTQGGADLAVGFGVEDESLVGLVPSFRVDGFLPGRRIVEPIRPDGSGHVVVIDLAHPAGPPTVFHELLRHGHGIGNLVPEMTVQIVDLDGVRT